MHIESQYSTVKLTPTPPILQQEEVANTLPVNYSVAEIVQAGIAEPPTPTVSPVKPTKKSASTDGLIKIINDHTERAQVYQQNEKQPENLSYFRVAKSRHGKFETDNQGFVNNSSNVFESTDKNNQQQTKDLLKKSEKEEQNQSSQIIATDHFKTTNDREKSPLPIQV